MYIIKNFMILQIMLIISLPGYAQLTAVKIEVLEDKYSICEGESAIINVLPVGNNLLQLKYSWKNKSGDDNISNPTFPQITVTPKRSDVFTVTVIEEFWKDTIVASVPVGVFLKPIVFAGNDTSICVNQTYIFSRAEILNETGKFWQHNGKGVLHELEDMVYYTPSNNETGKIYFILTATGNHCDNVSDTAIVTYVPAPNVQLLNKYDTICSNQNYTLSAQSLNYHSISWKIDGGTGNPGTLLNANSLNPVFVPPPGFEGQIMIILSAMVEGCSASDTAFLQIYNNSFPQLADSSVCPGDEIELTIPYRTGYSYQWNNGETGNSITVKPNQTQNYSVKITRNTFCSYTDTVKVTVIEPPVVRLEVQNATSQLVAFPSGLENYIFYNQLNAQLQSGFSNTLSLLSIPFDTDTIFVRAFNKQGCSNLNPLAEGGYYVMQRIKKVNVFTPNGDGINDRLLPGFKTTVFDRSGNILYEGNDGWNGISNGRTMPSGTYFYMLYDDSGELYYKGPVTLVRSNSE